MKLHTEKLEANLWKMNLYIFLYSLMFFTPIIVLFYQDNGLSLVQIMTIQSIASILWVLLEVPSGYFADKFGRKKSLILTSIFATLTMFFLGIGDSFYYFLVSSIFWVLAGVFVSGADSAFVYDTLKELKREGEYKKLWGNIAFNYSLGTALASIIGGIVSFYDLRYTFYIVFIFYACMIPVSLSLYEPKVEKSLSETNKTYGIFQSIKDLIFGNKKLISLLLYTGLIFSAIDVAYYLYQPYFKLSGLDIIYFGGVFASFNIIQGFSSKYAHIIEGNLGKKISLGILFILTSLCYFLMGNIIFVLSFIFAFLFQFVKGFSSIIISDYINTEITSNLRATVLSLQSLTIKAFYVILAPFVGYFADIYTLGQTFIMTGFLVFIVGFIFMISILNHH